MSPRLPPELLERVLQNLRGYRKTLYACTLASSSLLPFARGSLFDTVYLESDPESYQRFLRVLQDSPYLRSCVHNMHMCSIQYYVESVAPILRLVTGPLVSLHLRALDWSGSQNVTQVAVLIALASPSLESLHIDCEISRGLFIEPLLKCPKLRHAQLNLKKLTLDDGETQPPRKFQKFMRPKMESLVLISDNTPIIDKSHALLYMDLKSLRSIGFSALYSETLRDQLIATCRNTLTTFIWGISFLDITGWGSGLDLPFSDMPNLEHFGILLDCLPISYMRDYVAFIESLLTRRSSYPGVKPLATFSLCCQHVFARSNDLKKLRELKRLLKSLRDVKTTQLVYPHDRSDEVGPILRSLAHKYEGTTCIVIGPINVSRFWSLCPQDLIYDN